MGTLRKLHLVVCYLTLNKRVSQHILVPIRTKKDNKISRKTLRKQEIDRKNPKKRKADEVKLRVVKETPEVPSKQSKKEKRKLKKLSKNAQKELESEKKIFKPCQSIQK